MVDSTHDGNAAEFTMLIAAIAEAWPRLEAMFARGDEWREFAASLLYLLREAEEEGSQVHCIDTAIRALLAQQWSVHALVHAGIDRLERRSQADTSLQFPPRASDPLSLKRYQRVPVLFGTDRARRLGEPAERVAFGNERGALTFGQAEVSIPDVHKLGRLERPKNVVGIEFREHPDRHFVILEVRETRQDEFEQLARDIQRQTESPLAQALVFIHGFNVDFEESLRRTAQLANDLEFKGTAIAYSWPSQGEIAAYAADANVTEASMFHVDEFLSVLRSRLGLSRIHVVAHSMGSRVLARALDRHSRRAWTEGAPVAELNQIVFAAPDIDVDAFKGFATVFARHCARCTLYTSTRDLALKVSRAIYSATRLGLSAENVTLDGVDAIDVSAVDDSMAGHSYFSDRRELLQDLHSLFTQGQGAPRFGIKRLEGGAFAFKG